MTPPDPHPACSPTTVRFRLGHSASARDVSNCEPKVIAQVVAVYGCRSAPPPRLGLGDDAIDHYKVIDPVLAPAAQPADAPIIEPGTGRHRCVEPEERRMKR